MVGDWSNVKNALDVRCGRWILLNAVEMQPKKEGNSGKIVGMLLDSCEGIVGMVGDWSNVKNALDVGCERWILLNVVAMQLKKEGNNGRIVGMLLDSWEGIMGMVGSWSNVKNTLKMLWMSSVGVGFFSMPWKCS